MIWAKQRMEKEGKADSHRKISEGEGLF